MKYKTASCVSALMSIAFLFILNSCSQKQNWPQFRGPDGNMISGSVDLPEEWDSVKNVAWIYKPDGAGWSSPIVWGNKIFITSSFPEKVAPVPERIPVPGQPAGPPPPPDDTDTTFMQDIYRWELTCIDLNTGKELWRQVAYRGNPRVKKHQMNNYATETPVTDGKRIYAYFGNRGLYCFDLDGNKLWEKDFGAYKVANGWGTGSSPVIYNGVLYIQADNEENSFIVAIDAVTGEEKWNAARDEKTNYSTPYLWKNKVRTELIAGGKRVRSYDPSTGSLLWELKAGGETTIPSASGDENQLYIGNAGGQNAKSDLYAVRAGAEGDITPMDSLSTGEGLAWIFRDAALGNSSPLLYNGNLYIIGSRGGEVKCINAVTGNLVYKDRISGTAAVWASPWAFNDKIWFFDEKGITRSFRAGDKFELVDENRLDGKFWASVAITGDAYVFRGVEAMYCVKK